MLWVLIDHAVYVIVIHWEPTWNYGSKPTDPEGTARGKGLFT